MIAGRIKPGKPAAHPEVEMLFLPGDGQLSGTAECNVLVALDSSSAKQPAAAQAHLIVSPDAAKHGDQREGILRFPLAQEWEQALEAVA